jgi:hypothetical protein
MPYISLDNLNWNDGCIFRTQGLIRIPNHSYPNCGTAISTTSALFYGGKMFANTTYYFKVKAQDSIQSSAILFSSTSETKSITTGA